MNESLLSFLLRYFPVFMGTIFMAIFSTAMVVVLVDDHYLGRLEPSLRTESTGWGLLSLTFFFGVSNFMIARGYRWAAGLFVGYFAFCLMLVVPTIQYRPHTVAFSLGVLFPVLGLLLLNTERHREMRQKLFEVRIQRNAAKAIYKKHVSRLKAGEHKER
ncbi:hypothetical protein [Pseudomonas sp. NFPP28]|uniref:hypothetical protein n=1 Tax=Pseudomonas sp. NFPP28 TaxID=1566231 RepID=UPI002114ED8B|nr:hypothetical protein [Pseudomonas sp. NFPP28]